MPVDEIQADNGTPNAGGTPTPAPESNDVESIVTREIKAEEDKDKPPAEDPARKPEAEKFFLKNWKTQEDATRGLTELEQKLTAQSEELKTLKAQPPQAKPGEVKPGSDADPNDLTAEEYQELLTAAKDDPACLRALVQYESAKGIEAFKKEWASQFDGRLKPLEAVKNKLDQDAWKVQQESFDAETKALFDDFEKGTYDRYKKLGTDPAVVEKTLKESANGQQIVNLLQSGDSARAIRLLYQEFQRNELLGERKARTRSTRADAPTKETSEPPKKGKQTVEDIAAEEFQREQERSSAT